MIAFLHFPATVGYAGVALLVGAESAGVPVPGETSLVAAAVLASQGHLFLPFVIAVAAGAAIVGDNIGYVIGRRGGGWLLTRSGRWQRSRTRLLERGEAFFARHGAEAVFLGRWIPWLRVTAAWLAGTNRMRWPRFFFWNALGAMTWATSVGVAAYFLGNAAGAVLGLGGLALLVLFLVGGFVLLLTRRRAAATASEPPPPASDYPPPRGSRSSSPPSRSTR